MDFQKKNSDSEGTRQWSKPQLGLIVGFATGALLVWSTYAADRIAFEFVPPEIEPVIRMLWEIVSIPGVLIVELFGTELYQHESNSLSLIGFIAATIGVAVPFSLVGVGIAAIVEKRQRLIELQDPGSGGNAETNRAPHPIRNGLISGFLCGSLLTLALWAFGKGNQSEHDTFFWLMTYAWIAAYIPSHTIARILGWEWSIMHVTPPMLLFILLLNGLMFSGIGAVFGYAWHRFFKAKPNAQTTCPTGKD